MTLSSSRTDSSVSSTSSISTFFLHAFFPFLLDCARWEGAPSAELAGFLPFASVEVFVCVADLVNGAMSRMMSRPCGSVVVFLREVLVETRE